MRLNRLLLLLPFGTTMAGGFQVTFDTTECNGDTGFASVDIDRVYRIETTECSPEHQNKKMKQVYVRSFKTGFDVFTVTPQSAKRLQAEIKDYMAARKKAIEEGSTVILQK